MLTKKVKMYDGYLHILGMVHDCKWIAANVNSLSPAYEMKNPHKQGAMD